MPPTVPPAVSPPAGKRMSPWVWCALGCGGVLVVFVVIALVGGLFVGRKVRAFTRDAEANPAVAAARMIVRMNPELEEVSADTAAGTLTIRNRTSGETITLNASDIERGRVSFSGADGGELSIEAGAEDRPASFRVRTPEGDFAMQSGDADDLPDWVPSYPRGEGRQTWTMQGPEGVSGGVTYRSTDAFEIVIAHYEKALKDAGFEVTASTFQQDGQIAGGVLNGVHESDKRRVSVVFGAEDGGVQVTVTYGTDA